MTIFSVLKKAVLVSLIFLYCSLNVTSLYAKQLTTQSGGHMKFNHFAYIFLGPDLDPARDRTSITTPNFTFTTVGIDFQHKEAVIKVAKEMVAQGAQLIELCGGFGPLWIAKVSEALNFSVPVGSVAYGPEARKPLLDLLT